MIKYPIEIDMIEVLKKDMTPIYPYLDRGYRMHVEHTWINRYYQMLAYISDFYEDEVIGEVGTSFGTSALCMAMNRKNKIITYDIEHTKGRFSFDDWDIKQTIVSCADMDITELRKCPLIFLDIDHGYTNEIDFYNRLCAVDYDGILICDDIKKVPYMQKFWNEVTHPKVLLENSIYSRPSGFGAIDFTGKESIKMI
jgi:hypothetical protein